MIRLATILRVSIWLACEPRLGGLQARVRLACKLTLSSPQVEIGYGVGKD